MLALASELTTLETDPSSLGKRYQLTASLPASAVPQVRRLPGVAAAAPRYEVHGRGRVLARRDDRRDRLPGRPRPLRGAAARQRAGGCAARGEAEVGRGLAEVLGLSAGSPLPVELPIGTRSCASGSSASSTRSTTTGASPTSPPRPCSRPIRRRRSRWRCGCSPAPIQPPSAASSPRSAPARATHGRRHGPRRRLIAALERDPARRGDRRRARLPVHADAGAGPDGAGAPRTIAVLRACGGGRRRGAAPARRRAAAAVVVPAAADRDRCSSASCSAPAHGTARRRLRVAGHSSAGRRAGRARAGRPRPARASPRCCGSRGRPRASRSWRGSVDERGLTRRQALARISPRRAPASGSPAAGRRRRDRRSPRRLDAELHVRRPERRRCSSRSGRASR